MIIVDGELGMRNLRHVLVCVHAGCTRKYILGDVDVMIRSLSRMRRVPFDTLFDILERGERVFDVSGCYRLIDDGDYVSSELERIFMDGVCRS